MDQSIADRAQTSTATTPETEPEVVAAIASGDTNPSQPVSFRVGAGEFDYGRTLLLLAAGLALGCSAAIWLRRRG